MALLKQRKAIVLAAVTLFVLLGAGIGYYLLSPSSMIAIDVNPSIEIHTNRLGEVVSIDPVNEDAVQLMSGYQLTDKNLESVIRDIVDRMILNGYLVNEDTDQILISADQNSNSDALLNEAKTAFSDYLQEKQISVELLDQKVDMNDDSVEEAHENSVSVGKMALINKITENNNNAAIADFTGDTVKELVQYAADHNISLGDLMRNYHAAAAGQNDVTTAADAVTSASVTPTPDALKDGTTIRISTGKDSKFEDADDDSDVEDASEDQEDDDKAYVKETSRTVKGREDAEEEDSEDADSQDEDSDKKSYQKSYVSKEDSTDAVSSATVKSDKEDGSTVTSEDAEEDDDEGNYLKEDNEDNNFQSNEDRDEDSQGDDEEGGSWRGDEGDDD